MMCDGHRGVASILVVVVVCVVFLGCMMSRQERSAESWAVHLVTDRRRPKVQRHRLLRARTRSYWIGPSDRAGNAFSPAIAIPSITNRATSSQKFPTGESAYFLRV